MYLNINSNTYMNHHRPPAPPQAEGVLDLLPFVSHPPTVAACLFLVSCSAVPVTSSTAAASGKGVSGVMLRQRTLPAAAGPSKVKVPSSSDVSARPTVRARGDEPVLSGKLHLLDVYLAGAEGTGRLFRTPTGVSTLARPDAEF